LNKDIPVAFLVVNKNMDLPRVAVESVLSETSSDVFVGYSKLEDLQHLPTNDRIKLIKLNASIVSYESDQTDYRDFANVDFYKIVQLKWQLFEEMLKEGQKYFVYSDFDVTWLANPLPSLVSAFERDSGLQIQVQSFSSDPSTARICMGFVAFRVSTQTREFILNAQKLHAEQYLSNPYIGDDDVVTELVNELGRPNWIRELPQSTFPVGSLANLYSRRNLFPGLSAPLPYIFHANYVVGLKNKRVLAYLVMMKFKKTKSFSKQGIFFHLFLFTKARKHQLGTLASKFK
jgi:hypothetical protein